MKLSKIKYPIAFLIMFTISIKGSGCKQNVNQNAALTEPIPQEEPAKPIIQKDKNALIGDWERTDAPYLLKITELRADGMIKAGYFNPKSINIGKATWNSADNKLSIYVELRDENYPGSNYKLFYSENNQMLVGQYYQAVEGTTYNVSFIRRK